VTALADLLKSYLDLQTHFDPAAASAAGLVSADARLGAFDARSMREHLAAFHSVAGAIEDLDIDDLDDEIDRTALLAELRLLVARFEQERPHVRNPAFWVEHAHTAVESLLGRATPESAAPAVLARIAAFPDFFEAARATIRRPPLLLVDAALARLGPTGELLVRAAAELGATAPGGADAMNPAVRGALEALARFGRALRDEIEPEPEWLGAALGEERLHRRLEEAYAIRATPAELARWAREILESAPPVPYGVAAEHTASLAGAQERARLASGSPVRRELRSAVAVQGWALYAAVLTNPVDGAALLREAAARLLADVGLHAGGMSPAEAAGLLVTRGGLSPQTAEREIRRIAAAPGSGLAAAAGYREIEQLWKAYAAERRPDRHAFHEELLRYAALPPGLAVWGMGMSR
jgi:uncharacterized protein DUF885